MIVNRDINPERDVYYLGAKVIDEISNTDENDFDFFDIFQKLNETEKISINLYSLILDWLFLLGVIRKNKKGTLEKCF